MCGKGQLSGEKSRDSQAAFFFLSANFSGNSPIVSPSLSTDHKQPFCKVSCQMYETTKTEPQHPSGMCECTEQPRSWP